MEFWGLTVYVLLIPPAVMALTALVLLSRKLFVRRPSAIDSMEAHQRCLEALDPRAAARKNAPAPPPAAPPVRRHA